MSRGGVLLAYLGLFLMGVLNLFVTVPMYLHLLTDVLLVIYIGSQNSLSIHSPNRKDEGGLFQSQPERMQSKDVYMFPVYGSCVLFGLYMVYRLVPKDYVNILLKTYFFIIGSAVLTVKIAEILELTSPQAVLEFLDSEKFSRTVQLPAFFGTTTVPLLSAPVDTTSASSNGSASNPTQESAAAGSATPVATKQVPHSFTFNLRLVVGAVIAVAVGIWYLKTDHWLSSNIFAIAFSLQGIELLSLGSFFNGVILLSGLFFYDIFWVFGTDVMVTVAKNFDAPIKLLFPQGEGLRPAMLGLGDVVIPGFFIALLLRFDYKQAGAKINATRVYFWSNMLCYSLGIIITLSVMFWFKAAQPALLYLVPACLGGALVTATIRKEFRALWSYSEADDPVATVLATATSKSD